MHTDPMPHFARWTTAAVAGLAAVVLAVILTGCAASSTAVPPAAELGGPIHARLSILAR
ncbi:MAG: hypothetical protein ABI467_01250 [Kofleriaceae bacterium]